MIFRRMKSWMVALAVVAGVCYCPGAAAGEFWEKSRWWPLPEGVSSYSKDIDALFYGIVILTGVVFVATEACLLWFMIRYRKQEGQKSFYTHGNHKLEMIWTLSPALILVVIALVQARTWNDIKDPSKFPTHEMNKDAVHVQLFAKQFSWFFRYPNAEGKYGGKDCVSTERKLVVPVNTPVILEMTSNDVIHSFFLPNMRLKQDVVPGMHINCWFDANQTTDEMRIKYPTMTMENPLRKMVERTWNYPIVCAELCGNQHYQMFGIVEVLTREKYDEWLKKERAAFAAEEKEEQEIFAKWWKVDEKTQKRVFGDNDNKRNALPAIPVYPHTHTGGEKHGEGAKHAEEKK